MNLPEVFQDGMMLQRGKTVPVWGQTYPGANVKVCIKGQTAVAMAGADGSFKAELQPLDASEGEELTICTEKEKIKFHDVAIGEIWLAGGQSNMEFALRYEKHRKDPDICCPDARLRFFDVPEICFDGAKECFDYSRVGRWRKGTEEDLDYFSAVGYYFQKELKGDLDVPVGIIGCNWGGTRSCAWIPQERVETAGKPWMDEYRNFLESHDMDAWLQKQKANPGNDTGNPLAEFLELILPRTILWEDFQKIYPDGLPDLAGGTAELLPKDIPGSLYKYMLKTVAPFGIRGVLWYQGESDDIPGRQALYQDMLTSLISEWRALWGDTKLPFLIVQLPGWESWLDVKNDDYAAIRRCQKAVADTVPYTWLCSISDSGERLDIHPKDKKVTGERLALLARNHVYGEELLSDPPCAVNAERTGSDITIQFAHAEGGLHVSGDQVNALHVISGGKETPFSADVNDNTIHIHLTGEIVNDIQQEAIQIEFAEGKWYQVNLFNAANIPAVPFTLQV